MKSLYLSFISGLLVLSLSSAYGDGGTCASCALLLTSSAAGAHKEEVEYRKTVTQDAVKYMSDRAMNGSGPSYTLTAAMRQYKTLLEQKDPNAAELTFEELVDQYLDEVSDCQN